MFQFIEENFLKRILEVLNVSSVFSCAIEHKRTLKNFGVSIQQKKILAKNFLQMEKKILQARENVQIEKIEAKNSDAVYLAVNFRPHLPKYQFLPQNYFFPNFEQRSKLKVKI